MGDLKDQISSEEDNRIAIDQLDLMQTMIPEETSLPSEEEEEEGGTKSEKQLQREEPRKVQRPEVNRTRTTDERKWKNSKETKPRMQRK